VDEKKKEELLKEIEEYTEKIEKEPNNDIYYNNRGLSYFLLKKYEEAINDCNRAIELNLNNASYYYNRACSYYCSNKYDKAIEDYDKAIKLNPNDACYFNNRGHSYFALNKYSEAIEDYDKAIKLDPNNASYYYKRGFSYYALNKYNKAIEDYNKAIKLDPNNAAYFSSRGDIYYYEKAYNKAIEDYNKAIKLDPNNAFYYDNRGLAYEKLKKYKEAINDYNKAIKLNPNNAFYCYNRGFTYNKLKKYKEAINDYDKAIKLDPNNASYFNNRGVAYNNLGEYSKALEDYDKAIKLNPNYTFAYNNKGITFDNLGEFEEAIMNYNKAIELDPSYKSAIENRNFSLKELENFRKNNQKSRNNSKIDEISEAQYQTDFNNAKALHLQGEIDDNFKKAEKEFSSFINNYQNLPDKPRALENLLIEATSYLIASKVKIKRLKGYLIFADILGWKGIWKKQNTDNGKINSIEKLTSIKKELEKVTSNINLISDTFIIYSENSEMSNNLSKKLIELCLENDLVIRGAISYGECFNKDTVYIGPAVDEAASWHDEGEEIGIFYTPSGKQDIINNKYNLPEDFIKLKSGEIKTFFIDWYNNKTKEKFYELFNMIDKTSIKVYLKYLNTEKKFVSYENN